MVGGYAKLLLLQLAIMKHMMQVNQTASLDTKMMMMMSYIYTLIFLDSYEQIVVCFCQHYLNY